MKTFRTATEFRNQLNIGRTSFWKLKKDDPDFPTPVKITPGCEGFVDEECDDYIALVISRSRDSEQAA